MRKEDIPSEKVKPMNISDQVFLTLLYETLKSGEPETFKLQMPKIVEKYQSMLQEWNGLNKYQTSLYNRISSHFDALKKSNRIKEVGQDGARINYKVVVDNEDERIGEIIQLFEQYIEYMQHEIAYNDGSNLIFSKSLINELLLYHGEDIYDDYYEG